MRYLKERVFTDADFDNRIKSRANPGEIWAKAKELDALFEAAKSNKSRRMKENMCYNGRPRKSLKQESADTSLNYWKNIVEDCGGIWRPDIAEENDADFAFEFEDSVEPISIDSFSNDEDLEDFIKDVCHC